MSSRARGWSDLMPTLVLQVEVVPATQGSPDAVGVTFVCLVLSPRTRGDPDLFKQFGILRASSPHMRGWSGVRRRLRTERSVVPARAGVVPATRWSAASQPGRPRAREGGPNGLNNVTPDVYSSPHAGGSPVFPLATQMG